MHQKNLVHSVQTFNIKIFSMRIEHKYNNLHINGYGKVGK